MRIALRDHARLFVDIAGTELRVEGDHFRCAPALVMVHGGPGSDHSAFRPTFDGLADVAQVVFYDQRGMGRSDRRNPEEWNLSTWTADLLDLVARLQLDRPVLLGQSFGGYVAISAAASQPGLFSGLILSSAQAKPDPANSIARFRALGGDAAGDAAEAFFAHPNPATYADFRELCNPLYNPKPADPAIAEREIRTPDVLFHFWQGEYRGLDLTPLLSLITAPTLVIAGGQDPMIPAERSAALAAGIVNAALVETRIIPGAGHGPYRDAPVQYLRFLREFLASVAELPNPAWESVPG